MLAIGALGAIELSEINSAKAKMQKDVDMAALQGARELSVDSSPATVERARLAADREADPLRRRWTIDTKAVAAGVGAGITVTQDGVRPSFFGSLLPPGGFRIQVSASANLKSGKPLCVLGLDTLTTAVLLEDSSKMTAADCLVHSQGSIKVEGGASLNAGSVHAVRRARGPISPAPVTDVPTIADPFASLPIAFPSRCDYDHHGIIRGSVTFNPGVHCGVMLFAGGGKVHLNPGEHYFDATGLSVSSDIEISGTDVVLIFKDSKSARLAGKMTLSLEGRRSGPFAGFVIMTDRSFTGTLEIAAEHARHLLGTIYIPQGKLKVSGEDVRVADKSPWTIVVARQIEVADTARLVINANYKGSAVPRPNQAGLVRLTE